MSTITNGQIRKSLASQLDRLEGILDSLDKNLAHVVAASVQQAVSSAVEVAVGTAVVEVLTNPTLQQRLHAGRQHNGIWTWLKGCVAAGWKKLTFWVKKAFAKASHLASVCKDGMGTRIAGVGTKAKGVLKGAWSRTLKLLSLAGRWRKTLLLASAAGLTLGVACYFSGPTISSLISFVTGFVSTVAARAWSTVVGLLGGEESPGT